MRALVPWKPWEDEVDAVVGASSAAGGHERNEGGVVSCVPDLATDASEANLPFTSDRQVAAMEPC